MIMTGTSDQPSPRDCLQRGDFDGALDNLRAEIWRKRCEGETEIAIVLTKDIEQILILELYRWRDASLILPNRLPKGGSIWGCKYYRYDDTLPPIRADSILFYREEERCE